MSEYEPSSLDTTAPREGLERQGQLPLTEMHDSRGWQLSGDTTDGQGGVNRGEVLKGGEDVTG